MIRKQEYLLELLLEIDGICRRNDVEYFLVGGTLLGAVRGGGFLPWDDDIDMAMTYDNWLKFKKACETDIPENRVLCSIDTQGWYPNVFPRYMSTDTTCIHTAQSLHDSPAGELIDIFIFDPVADGDEALEKYVELQSVAHDIRNYASVLSWRYGVGVDVYDKYDRIKQEHGDLYVCQKIEEERVKLFDPNGNRYVYRSTQGPTFYYPREWFDGTFEVEFEGHKFLAPQGTNQYLSAFFGKEWAELPGSVNPAKHDTGSSLDFPSSEALEYYKPSCDREELLKKTFSRKRSVIARCEISNTVNDEMVLAQARCVKLELEHRLRQYKDAFEKAYAERDTKVLGEILSDFMSAQMDRNFIGRRVAYDDIYRRRNQVLIDVPDEVIESIIWILMDDERMGAADRLIDIRVRNGFPLSPKMQASKDALDKFTLACDDCQAGDYASALEKAKELAQTFPSVPGFHKLVITCTSVLHGEGKISREDCLSEIQRGRQMNPSDGYYLKLYGDLQYEDGETEEALSTYLCAAESTRNGFALRDIQEKTGYWPRWIRATSWGKAFGIPEWQGETPKSLPKPSAPERAIPQVESAQEYQYRLLCELAELCEKSGIGYSLDKDTAAAIVNRGSYASLAEGYAIVCSSKDFGKLTAAVKAQAGKQRHIEESDESGAALLYVGDDSLFLNLKKQKMPAKRGMYIKIKKYVSGTQKRKASFVERLKRKFAPSPSLSTKTVVDKVAGHSFECVEGWSSLGTANIQKLRFEKGIIASAVVTPAEFFEVPVVRDDFFERRAACATSTKQDNATQKLFKRNHAEVKLAVAVKQAAFDLMPQKDRILELDAAGDTDALKVLMGSYIALARKNSDSDMLCFDKDIYDVLIKIL